jgi:hypothetical protein
VHLAQSLIHPIVFTSNGPQMDHPMLITFCVWWAGILSLGAAMFVVEVQGKQLDQRLRRIRARLATA